MADFNLQRIRFRWKNEWTAATAYVKDDIVYYRGKAYVCLIGHTSDATNLTTDLNDAAPKWVLMFDGGVWKNEWTTTTYYTPGDVVKFKGYVYQCITAHTSTNLINAQLPADIVNWSIVATTYNWLNEWITNTYYDLGDVVRYNGISYICSTKHRSAATAELGLEDDQASWTVLTTSDSWKADWAISTRYRVKDIVKYGGNTYRCITGHTSASTVAVGLEQDQAKWELYVEGLEYKGDWAILTRYKVNDIAKWGGSLWKVTAAHTATESLRLDQAHWTVWVPGLEFERNWIDGYEYNKGDIVRYGGYTYTALENNVNVVPSVNGLLQDTGDWEILVAGYRHLGAWNAPTEYKPGDVITDEGYLYICLADSSVIKPDTDTNKWQILVTGRKWKKEWEDNVEYYLGDVITYAGTAYIAVSRHDGTGANNRPDEDVSNAYWTVLIQGTSTNVLTNQGDIKTHNGTDVIRLPAGNRGAILKPGVSGGIVYEQFDASPKVFYVSQEGLDDPFTGTTTSATFRTIQYGLQYISNNLSETTYNSVPYETADLSEIDTTVIMAALTSLAASETLSNAPNLQSLLESTNTRTGYAYGDLSGNGTIDAPDAVDAIAIALGQPTASQAEVLAHKDIVDAINDNFSTYVGETVTYANSGSPFTMSVTQTDWPNTSLIVKTGIYEEDLPLRIPRNCALIGDELRSTVIQPIAGKETSNMIYVNNGSGLRNMTLQGLVGELPIAGAALYGTRTPSAGAFVSLDPGTGPTDETVWITNKSPYVQNVTTFGTACIGMKIDGTLHNGGNKSVTANDFTQVISDGIGYWANEAGRSELVSVFTYFCYIGYFATQGGILRATNGNNSYGTFGSRAEGYSLFETPITAQMDNRTNEALIDIVHTTADELLAVGYNHAGQSYTSSGASITFEGTGINASAAFEEVRDNAISQLRVIDPADSSTPGGINYQYLLNSAQGGDDTQIILAAADDSGTAAKYVGMRIVIVSGTGVGQYGYISAYNELLKAATISKECNDTNGWENLYPGRPIEALLDSTTRYSLEPRVIIDNPGWTESTPAITWPAGFLNPGSDIGLNDIVYVNGKYVALNSDRTLATSTDGLTFTAGPSPTGSIYGHLAARRAISSTSAYFLNIVDDSIEAYDVGNETWSTITLPSGNYESLARDNSTGTMVAQDGNDNVVRVQSNSTTTATAMSFNFYDQPRLPSGSRANGIGTAFGNGVFLHVRGNGNVLRSADDGVTWTENVSAIVSTGIVWMNIEYGNGRFVVVGYNDSDETARAAYSFDGLTWYYDDTNLRLMTNGRLARLQYHNGEFIASATNEGSRNYVKSKDGFAWSWFSEDSSLYTATEIGEPMLAGSEMWFGNGGSEIIYKINTGAGAVARATVDGSRIKTFIIYDPGANYTSTPGVLVFDPENTIDVLDQPRIENGVLSQPTWTNRGTGYVTAIATITGDGFADIYQTGKTVQFKNVSLVPGPGANVVFDSVNDVIYRLTKIVSQTGVAPNIDVTFEISPPLTNQNSPEHEESIIMRELYSQIRLTGHDFLDIGSGNVNSTRYPQLYLEGVDSLNEPQPFNEVTQFGGGRVFYTSTDQDGNFRVGELFAVEQSTGVVSINADFFELSGLEELSLGAIQLGGTAVVIREFSKEPTFSANSNNIVPTQKAIISYLTSRISGGGADAVTNTLIAGQVRINGQTISNDAGLQINIPVPVNIKGGIGGDALAHMFYSSGK